MTPDLPPDLPFDPARGFGVYVHWPYCTRICPYCDFNVYAAKSRDTSALFKAIGDDLAGWRGRTGLRRVDTVFLGGGTPSLLTGAEVAALLARVDALWGLAPDAEITLEANPDEAGRFADFAAAGVTRLSLGVQSLRDAQLAFLGRTHSVGDAIAALKAAQAHFGSVSLDLIYALPEQGADGWRAELGEALTLGAQHLSLYELTLEPGAAFSRAVRRGEWAPASDDRAADLYDLTQEMCEAAGMPAYEVSNHACAPEHRSRHNTIYWRSGDWAGVGPGAHGRLTEGGKRFATEAADKPDAYMRQVSANGLGWSAIDELDALAQARERIAMGLRHAAGLPVSDVAELGLALNADALAGFARLGLLSVKEGRVALTQSGRLTADRIAAELSP